MARRRKPTERGAGRRATSEPASGGAGRWRGWLGVGIVLAATALLYVPALNNEFTNWDDDRQVTANRDIRDLSPQGVKKMFSSYYVSLYQPLTSLSFAVEYRLFGLDAQAYHAVNVLLHLANILLVYAWVRSLSQSRPVALAVAALFAAHPLQVEAVAWVSARSILLSCLFYLGAMIAYVAYAKSGKVRWFAAVLVLSTLAILAKTTAATLPLALVVIDLYLRRKISLRTLCEKVPFLVQSAVFGYIAVCARGGVSHIQDFALRYSPVQRVCVVCYSCLWYPGKLIFPTDLSAFYPFPYPADGWLPPVYYMAPLLLIGLAVGIWYGGRNRRLLAFAGLFILASLVLVIQVVPISELMVCDRYAYLPCLGLFFLVATLGRSISLRGLLWKRVTLVGVGLVLAVLGGLTFQRIEVWRDSLTLWNDVIAKYKGIWVAYHNRGLAEFQARNYKAAVGDFDAALQLNPWAAEAFNSRAVCHSSLGDGPAALRDFDDAIRLKPDGGYLTNRGMLKRSMKDFAGAIKDFDAALEQDPRNIDALCQRADSHGILGNRKRAIEDYEAVLRLAPAHSGAAFCLGIVLLDEGDSERAAAMFNKAIALGHRDAGLAYFFMARAYQKLGRADLAAEALRRSRELGTNLPPPELPKMPVKQ